MAPSLTLTLSDRDLRYQIREILLEEGGHCIGLIRHLYRSNPRVIGLLREVSWGWTTVQLRPGVMEELGDTYSLPAGTRRCLHISTIADAAGHNSGLLLALQHQFCRVPGWRLGRVTLLAIGPQSLEISLFGTSGRPRLGCLPLEGKTLVSFPFPARGAWHPSIG